MTSFDQFALDAVQYAAQRSIAFSVVFLVVGATWLLLKKRLGSHVGSLWFVLPLIVLVVPVENWVPSPWTSSNPIESAARTVLPAQVERIFESPETQEFLDLGAGSEPVKETRSQAPTRLPESNPETTFTSIPPASILFCAWGLGLLLFLARLVQGQRSVPKLLRRTRPLEEGSLPVDLVELCKEAGIARAVQVFESPEFDSPALWTGPLPKGSNAVAGEERPASVILPEGLSQRLSPLELRWVLLHELAHLSRRDHYTELFQRLIGAAFFFHPLVWATNRIARAYRELACDDAALARCATEDRSRCARALYEVVSHAAALATTPTRSIYRTTHAMSSLFQSKKLTRKRIMRLIEVDRPLARGLRISALMPILLVSGAALAAAHFPPEEAPVRNDAKVRAVAIPEDAQASTLSVRETRAAANRATQWLLSAQNENGSWTYQPQASTKSGGSSKEVAGWAAALKGPGAKEAGAFKRYHDDVALTALAVQALYKASLDNPLHVTLRSAVKRGLEFLLARQDLETGQFATEGFTLMVSQAMATEAIAMARDYAPAEQVKASLRASVEFLERARNPYGAWRYDYPPAGDNDSRITAYVLLALSSAYEAGVHADSQTFADGMSYLAEMEDESTGRTNYMGERPYALRILSHKDSHPAERAEEPTATHMRLRNISGQVTAPSGAMNRAADLLRTKAPLWDTENGTIDYTYWWHGTEALAGFDREGAAWQEWSSSLSSILIEEQVVEGPMKGTWPGVDAWSVPGMEAYTTATGALALYAVLEAQ